MTRNMRDNMGYSLKSIWKAKKSVFIIFIFSTLLLKVQPFVLILFPKFVIDSIERNSDLLWETTLLIFFFALVTLITVFLQRYTYSHTSVHFLTYRLEKRRELSAKTIEVEYDRLEDPTILDLYKRAQDACRTWNTGMEGIFRETMQLILSILSSIGFITILISLNLFVCVILVFISVLCHIIKMKISNVDLKHRESTSSFSRKIQYYSDVMTEPKTGKDIRLFNAEILLHNKFTDAVTGLINLKYIAKKEKKHLYICVYVLDVIKILGFFTYLAYSFMEGNFTTGSLIMYISTFANFTIWFDEIVSSVSELKRLTQEIDDFRNVMALPVINDDSKVNIEKIERIEFINVFYKYRNTNAFALSDISFVINENENISLVGINGSGKTTIVKLICGFYMPTHGEIFINNIPMSKINRKSLHNQIAAVFQEINILAFSISSNIAMCKNEDIDREKVLLSLKKAGFEKIVEKYGIDTIIQKILNDEGIELSGGENQGIAIARTIYKDKASLMLLDEPTSHLDALMERKIYNVYHQISGKCISIFISHRLASAQFCDKVLFIENGCLLGFDKHEQLLLDNQVYQAMYDVQAKYYGGDE